MTELSVTTYEAYLKRKYTPDKIYNLAYSERPLLAMLPKDEKFGGSSMSLPVESGPARGVSASFAQAQSLEDAASRDVFIINRTKYYGIARIDNEVIDASLGDLDAFMNAEKAETESIFQHVANRAETYLFRTGTGSVGNVGSTSTTALTLSNIEDVVNFERGDSIGLSATDGSEIRIVGGAKTYIRLTAVNRDTGVLTGASNWSTITGVTNGDFIYRRGDARESGTGAFLVIAGLGAWVPSTTPTSTTFNNVDRSTDPTRLGGIRYNGGSEPIAEALINAIARGSREECKPDFGLSSHRDMGNLMRSLQTFKQFITQDAPGEVSFDGVKVQANNGTIDMFGASRCPFGRAYLLTKDSWKLYSAGQAPKLLRNGGGLIRPDGDVLEVRVGYYAQLGCRAPGRNITVQLAAS